MNYCHFIKTLESHQTKSVKAVALPESCGMMQIPSIFSQLFPNIFKIIQLNIKKLCDKDEIVAIFGLQASFTPIVSSLPKQLNRVISDESPGCHFCCNLNYLSIKPRQCQKINSWGNAKAIVVDFTSGAVMDANRYLYKIFNKGDAGIIYGWIDRELLEKAWGIVVNDGFRIIMGANARNASKIH